MPHSGTYAAAEPAILALRSLAEGKMLVPMETDCISAQDELQPGGMGIEALRMARAPCMLCRPTARWSCPLCGHPISKAKRSRVLDYCSLRLCWVCLSARVVTQSCLCSVWLFLVSMNLTGKYSHLHTKSGDKLQNKSCVSSRCHQKTSVKVSLKHK